MSRSELFHVGIVVPDLELARDHYTAVLGVVFGPIVEGPMEVRDAEGNDLVFPHQVSYTTTPPYLELIQEMPGTIWVCNEYSNLHHLGYWSDDLAGDALAMTAARCPMELHARVGLQCPEQWIQHRDRFGVRIEMIDAALQPAMEQHVCRPADPAQ
jgi:catechol 2,3-dioxygenase-like lactoylglutathione lyase family enzyme